MPTKPEQISVERLVEVLGVPSAGALSPVTWQQVPSADPLVDLFAGEIVADSQGGKIPCLLYRPQTGGPHPGVVAIHQHNDEYLFGKREPAGLAGDPNAAYGLALAKQGFIVAMPDLMGFEERGRAHGRTGRELELFLALNAVANGHSLHGTHVSDVCAVARYLETYEEVVGPIAVAGHSLGGQIALLVLAVDPLVKVGAISGGLTTVAACQRADILHNPGWYVPGLEALGGYQAIAGSIYNKLVLSIFASHDEHFPADGAREVLSAFAGGVVDSRWRTGSHAMDRGTRELMATWLAKNHDLKPER